MPGGIENRFTMRAGRMTPPTTPELFNGWDPDDIVTNDTSLAMRDAIKRGIDIAGGLCGVGLLLVVTPLVALATWLDSGRPVFFRQRRVGRGGRPFMILKFRTMIREAELDGHTSWSPGDDPRVTRVGRWLRRFHIDELPNLVNVLVGEMSLVGPRPERTEFVAQLEVALANYGHRHVVRPGITGLSQLHGPYTDPLRDAAAKLDHDLRYVAQRSLALDLRIFWRTALMLVGGMPKATARAISE